MDFMRTDCRKDSITNEEIKLRMGVGKYIIAYTEENDWYGTVSFQEQIPTGE